MHKAHKALKQWQCLLVKPMEVGLKASFAESIFCKSGTSSCGMEEKASLDK